MHQPVVPQIVQRLRGAVLAQVAGAHAVDLPRQAQRAGDEAGIHHRAGAQHAVKALAHQVHAALGAAQLQLQRGVARQQLGQARHDHVARHAGGHVDAHPALQAALAVLEHGLQLVQVGQQVLAAFVIGLAVLGELHAPGRAVQQAGAQLGFELLHGRGSAGLGQAQGVGGLGEAGQLGHPREDAHALQGIHCSSVVNDVIDFAGFIWVVLINKV